MTSGWAYIEYLAFGVGLTEILMRGSIFEGLRRRLGRNRLLRELLSCSLCLGFWAGLLAACGLFIHQGIVHPTLPCVTSICAWLFDSVIGALHSVELGLDVWREEQVHARKAQMRQQQEVPRTRRNLDVSAS